MMGLAYRMTGSVAEAEDIVQDAWLRWCAVDSARIDAPKAYLLRIVSRLCLDQAKSARARRECYVGQWLPEPLLESLQAAPAAPDETAGLASDLSVALLIVLDRLSAPERAAFLLHDVFGVAFQEIGGILERSEESCRKLASRAREKVRAQTPERPVLPADAHRYFEAFYTAVSRGDLGALTTLLAADAVLVTDGGGRKSAALNPIYGRDRILRFFMGIAAKSVVPRPDQIRRLRINGADGLVIEEPEGGLQTWSFDWTAEGQVAAIYLLRNPDKLGHVQAAIDSITPAHQAASE